MTYLLIIILEILILFLLSKIIPSLLVQFFHFFIRSQRFSIWILSLLFFPGTFVHEMAHLLVAGVLLVPVGGITLIPVIREQGVKLGHVEIEKTDPIRRALIGFAPVFVGIASLVSLIYYSNSQFFQKGDYPVWLVVLLIYLVLVIGNTMFSSRKDLEGALGVVIVFASITGALYLLGLNSIFLFLKEFLIDAHPGFYKNFSIFLSIPVVADIFLYTLMKFVLNKLY